MAHRNDGLHKRTSSKLISIESTPDGDIQTVEETTITNVNNAFTHHLRHSWDDENNTNGNHAGGMGDDGLEEDDGVVTAGGGGVRTSHHKQNLSVQFFDFSISEETTPLDNGSGSGSGSGGRVSNHRRGQPKETIENTAAYYFDTPAAADDDDDAAAPSTKQKSEPNDDYTNFTNSIRNSWDLGGETTEQLKDHDGKHSRKQSFVPRHNQNLSVQFLDSTILEYSAEENTFTLGGGEEGSGEEGSSAKKEDANGGGKKKKKGRQRGSHQRGLSLFADNDLMDTIIDKAGTTAFEPPAPVTTSSSSPNETTTPTPIALLSPSDNVIVVPIPLRPAPGMGVSRKHRRVFSGR
eukprot:CAMPEP_0201879608 /NCGR_PEP_ID=MMETSP0902-20130614/10456_1 /ASSEMBLY_ACC=CAM_ASM_000551 /TAXON_ID=420261 /ORGANISM="Thalassiosira antarctica, Strain CCMP982" /LENGTH=349 /DNA_ID=CAMNT_0048407481 /DNA_START=99 /DNA_END=1145 /DNA_ORIENTATION=-